MTRITLWGIAVFLLALPASASKIPALDKVLDADDAPDSVQSFLVHPGLDPELRSNFSLARESPSLQRSTKTEPRVVMENADGSLSVTFIGNPHSGRADESPDETTGGYDSVEVLDYDKAAGAHRLWSVHFKKGERAHIEGPNPASCMECHADTSTRKVATPVLRPIGGWTDDEVKAFLLDKCRKTKSIGSERYSLLDCSGVAARMKLPDAMLQLHRKFDALRKNTLVVQTRAWPNYASAKYSLAASLASCPDIPLYFKMNGSQRQKAQISNLYGVYVTQYTSNLPVDAVIDFPSPEAKRKFLLFQRTGYAGLKFSAEAAGHHLEDMDLGYMAIARFRETGLSLWLEALADGDKDLSGLDIPLAELRRANALDDGDYTAADATKVGGFCSRLLDKSVSALAKK